MSDVPRIQGQEAVRAFKRDGFVVDRIKGSHHIMKKDGHPYILSVPVHSGKTLGVGLLKSLIEAAGLTVEQFKQLLKS